MTIAALAIVALSAALPVVAWAQAAPAVKPTIVLVHGAFAESSSWDGVVGRLQAANYPVIAAANPLRGVKADAAYVGGIVDRVPGPVVLVGHSYGGSVISEAAAGRPNVKSLVYVPRRSQPKPVRPLRVLRGASRAARLRPRWTPPRWRRGPRPVQTGSSYFVYGTSDKNIPAAAQAFMAERAHSVKTVVVDGGSHVIMVSKPDVVADLIIQAAAR
jgi:pimeloyl-ACP methyl ester carboxylesterase